MAKLLLKLKPYEPHVEHQRALYPEGLDHYTAHSFKRTGVLLGLEEAKRKTLATGDMAAGRQHLEAELRTLRGYVADPTAWVFALVSNPENLDVLRRRSEDHQQ